MNEVIYGDILTLSDNKKYVVTELANHNNKNYLYLVEIKDPKNIKFCLLKGDMLIELDPDRDCDLIALLLPHFLDSTKSHIKFEFEQK